jgi:hypothetical protein
MNPKNASTNTTSKVVVYNKKKEENNASTSNPLTHVSLVNNITGETPDPLISASNNAEMSDTISYNKAQRTCHQRRCKAGQVGKDGKIQSTLHAGETPDPLSCSSNNDEMLKSQVSQSTPECSITTDYWCKSCGALNVEVALSTKNCQECNSSKLYEATENQVTADYRFGDESSEYIHFLNMESSESLGTRDPEIHKINPYANNTVHVKSNAPCIVPPTFKIDGYLISNKASKTDDQRMFEEVNSQICNLANCLNDDSPVLRNWARKVIRLFSKSDDNEVSLVPKTNGHKQVAVNMYKKIIREFGHYIEATYPETPDHLSAKALGIHTWNFQLATKVKQDGKWIAKANVDIDVIMNILKAFSNTEINYPTIELVENEIIMYGDSNQRMSWQDKGKRNNMRNQAFQHFNMDELVLQSEYEDNTLIDRGVDGMFDGDIIYPVAGETPAPITSSKNTIFVFGSNEKGIHGKGSALEARKNHGAVLGKGVGLQGSSYAIPTKETPYKTLSLEKISKYVSEFVEFAKAHPEMTFNVVAIGCANAGYTPKQIAPLFGTVPTNVNLPESFKVAN